MGHDPTRTGIEGLKALLSLGVLWAGSVVSGSTMPPAAPASGPGTAEDVIGVWTWVVDASSRRPGADADDAPLVEFRRAADGRLEARALIRSNGRARIRSLPGVSFEDGRLQLELGDGMAFRGTLRDDGRSIGGVVESDGDPATSELRRLDPAPRRKAPRERRPLRAA